VVRVRLVLVGVEGPVNLGFIARLADNFDVDEFFIVNPSASIEEAKRYAARASQRLESAVITDSLAEALKGVSLSACTSAHYSRGKDIIRVSLSPWEFANRAVGERLVALVMGRESTGLTREEISLCDILVSIPTSSRYPSLNLSNATAILLYELYKARLGREWKPRVPPEQRIINLLLDYTSKLASCLAPHRRSSIVRSLRNLLVRADVSSEEAAMLLYLASRAWRRLGEECGGGKL
jgi:TrmH family RNA methyltransferase